MRKKGGDEVSCYPLCNESLWTNEKIGFFVITIQQMQHNATYYACNGKPMEELRDI